MISRFILTKRIIVAKAALLFVTNSGSFHLYFQRNFINDEMFSQIPKNIERRKLQRFSHVMMTTPASFDKTKYFAASEPCFVGIFYQHNASSKRKIQHGPR
jgi:hypothetical protein